MSAPANPSKTYTSSSEFMCSMPIRRAVSNCSGVMGWLTLPHQMLSWTAGVSSSHLSVGERPVRSPVITTSAPLSASRPSPLARARSIGSGAERFVRARPAERSSFAALAVGMSGVSCVEKNTRVGGVVDPSPPPGHGPGGRR